MTPWCPRRAKRWGGRGGGEERGPIDRRWRWLKLLVGRKLSLWVFEWRQGRRCRNKGRPAMSLLPSCLCLLSSFSCHFHDSGTQCGFSSYPTPIVSLQVASAGSPPCGCACRPVKQATRGIARRRLPSAPRERKRNEETVPSREGLPSGRGNAVRFPRNMLLDSITLFHMHARNHRRRSMRAD